MNGLLVINFNDSLTALHWYTIFQLVYNENTDNTVLKGQCETGLSETNITVAAKLNHRYWEHLFNHFSESAGNILSHHFSSTPYKKKIDRKF